MMTEEIKRFLRRDAKERFLRYCMIDTQSDPESKRHPSSEGQCALGRLLREELKDLDFSDAILDEHGYVYASLAATPGVEAPAITFLSHMDTSPSEPGAGVIPIIHENYDGGPIAFPCGRDLVLTPAQSPELEEFIGETLITSDGRTLLGADDKAGIAEIMAALAGLKAFRGCPHPELRIVFTPDEEIGQGADHISVERLGQVAYTLDGGMMGEIQQECFDAWEALITFHGRNIHPGHAKDRMVNAAAIAGRFVASLPEHESPEHTENREGFYHLTDIKGDENRADLKLIIRDFDRTINERRLSFVEGLAATFERRYAGLKIDLRLRNQYKNMNEVLARYPQVVQEAKEAIEAAGLTLIEKPIRGGTDGARLCFMGVPTPNLFTGAMMVHSKTEWIPQIALEKGAEVILHLCRLWAGK